MAETYTDGNGDAWEIYKDQASDSRWRRTASNGQIVGASTEGYANKTDCIANAKRNGMTCDPKVNSRGARHWVVQISGLLALFYRRLRVEFRFLLLRR